MTGVERETIQRTASDRSYAGHSVHAAPGVHEYAVTLVQAALPDGGRVLEVGAGCGALALRLRDAGFEVVPTDLEPPHDWIARLDLDHPELTDETRGPFDIVVCVETLEHVENPRQVLRSIRSMLRVGDRLLVSTPNVTHPHSLLKTVLRGAPVFFGPGHYYQPGHITLLPDWMLTEHVRQAGFDQLEVRTAGSMEYHGLRRLVHRVELRLLRLIGLRAHPADGEGICVFVTAVAV
ncbi:MULTISPECIES: class I SAM-dependent methyltransferase [unclassified Modestobacter]|uniref:class I SAM-dependent methyltransferase n=1 Tax=unclassified Modestobacter TaxID=2643866 RepID=UPI0022AA19E1|nr:MULTISPECIES: methyltransferase domain-containing protein [unclassified Modestobacter]MCZ2811675.1 methyltransferase domain-containing protein [Modestobacter sp. VKM Ac-2979]MCZ2843398.1 methyltransferase domain-containing protein [Modestobacter sp. VKM Ac-2980]MCZ2848643.1 methyltransferase domain-containing protein [Modestobacter sp. VKM Ac-2978]